MNTTMNTTDRATIVGVFEDRAHAQQAINDLKKAGFRDDQIGVTSRDAARAGEGDGDDGDSYAAEGGMTGLATGAGIGALWGLAVVSNVLPGIGPAIAGGTLAAILSSAAAGAAAAGLAGMLIGLGIPREEAEFYEGEFRAGRTLVTVKAEGKGAEAQSILRRNGGYDITTRGTRTGMEGKSAMAASPTHSALAGSSAGTFKSGDACSTTNRAMGTSAHTTAAGHGTIQASEEELRVHKEKQPAGEVTVRKEVHTEHKTLEVPVEREEVVIERHPVSGHQPASTQFKDGQTIRVPVSEEHVEIEKTPVVKEEISVGKRKVQDTKRVDATVRKEEIKVENKGDAKSKECR